MSDTKKYHIQISNACKLCRYIKISSAVVYNIETFKTFISTSFTPITSEKREFVIIPNYDRVALGYTFA